MCVHIYYFVYVGTQIKGLCYFVLNSRGNKIQKYISFKETYNILINNKLGKAKFECN